MIRIDNTETFGFDAAIRGMRNPYESHDKSDSGYCSKTIERKICRDCRFADYDEYRCVNPYFHEEMEMWGSAFILGNDDMTLAKKLVKAGPEHRKFLRMIHVQADVLAPRYWWAEMDKYKYVEANSSSTMHLITKRCLTEDDFSFDDSFDATILGFGRKGTIIISLNDVIEAYNAEKDKELKECLFRQIKQMLPESYNQLRTIDTNYECLMNIYHQRKNHRLSEWREFSRWIESLPYMDEFLSDGGQQIAGK